MQLFSKINYNYLTQRSEFIVMHPSAPSKPQEKPAPMKLVDFALRLLMISVMLFLSACTEGEPASTDQSADGNETESFSTDEEISDSNPYEGDVEWTVILYQDGDDDVLEEDMFYDLNEAEKVGSTDKVNIVSQFDRYDGAFAGDGDWTTTKRFFVTQDDDLETINSKELDDLGETNMSDADTLIDYVTWAIQNYPARKYALILSDHGMGWPGGWTDPDPDEEDQLYLNEIIQALSKIITTTGSGKLEFVGFDACLMSQLEVFSALEPYANYSVASEETEPAMGWAYQSFLSAMVADPAMGGEELAHEVVGSYIVEDERILDDDARYVLMGEEDTTQEEAVADFFSSVTLTAVDLSQIPALVSALNGFTDVLVNEDQPTIAEARAYAQSYESVFGDDEPASYIDLGNFAELAGESTGSSAVVQSARGLQEAIKNAVIAEVHGDERPGSTGIAIYYPVSDLFMSEDLSGVNTYQEVAAKFAKDSSWDDFLAFHYGLKEYDPQVGSVAQVENVSEAVAPGAEELSMDEIEVSSDTASAEEPVTFSTTVHGNKIGFIYTFIGYYDEDTNSILIADKDFIFADDTKEVSGVYYPDWGDSIDVDVEFEWDGTVFNLTDGENSEFALIEPADYGAADDDSTYAVYGQYIYAGEEKPTSAVMFLKGGELDSVYGYARDDFSGGLSEIIPSVGDQFTIYDQWITLDEDGNFVETTLQEGGTVTFSKSGISWEEASGTSGTYVVGFVAEDLDGNQYEQYTTVDLVE
jgi:hypothetical protein